MTWKAPVPRSSRRRPMPRQGLATSTHSAGPITRPPPAWPAIGVLVRLTQGLDASLWHQPNSWRRTSCPGEHVGEEASRLETDVVAPALVAELRERLQRYGRQETLDLLASLAGRAAAVRANRREERNRAFRTVIGGIRPDCRLGRAGRSTARCYRGEHCGPGDGTGLRARKARILRGLAGNQACGKSGG